MRITRWPIGRWIKRALVAAILLAITAVIVWSMLPRPVTVEVAQVRRGQLAVTVDEDGRARVQDRYVVTAPLAGTLARIELHAGDTVVAGAVLGRIAPMPSPLLDERSRAEVDGRVDAARARRKQAAASVKRAEVAAAYATSELERFRALAAQGAVPGIDLERRQLEHDVAVRDLESARFAAVVAASEVETAEALAARLEHPERRGDEVLVRAPVVGRILRVLAESESAVGPGTPLVELGDPAHLEVVVDVLTADAVAIRPTAPVELVGWGGPPLAGVVRRVEPSARTRVSALGVEEQRVSVIVDLTGDPAAYAGLGDGWRVEARILTWVGDDVVCVPLSALFRRGDDWAVFVVDGDRARLRKVALGHRSGAEAEVASGLAPGERVVVHPGDRVDDGVRIAPR